MMSGGAPDHLMGDMDAAVSVATMEERGLDETYTDDYTTSIPDILLLNHYCANAVPPSDSSEEARQEWEASWEPAREWLRTHQADEVRAAAHQRGESSMTALHFACRNVPPPDVIEVFLAIAGEVVQWPDSFGWLPIHYACACGADAEVIRSLAEAFPDSKTTVDRRGRTPLHFALGNSNPDKLVSPDVVILLSSTGAAGYDDDNGMLPLHYACAYGASEDALCALTDAYPKGITTMDCRGRTPLHFALSNAGRSAAPAAVRLLLSLNRDIVNSINGGPLPLRVLAEFARTLRKAGAEERESVERCLEHLLNAKPDPTADFLTALQSLPEWLSERAVVMPVVQILLNEKISQRFPTAVLMLDLYFLAMVIFVYSLRVVQSIEKRFPETTIPFLDGSQHVSRRFVLTDQISPDPGKVSISGWQLLPLYLGAAYFFVREFIQIVSLISLKSVHLWVYSIGNWLNVTFIFLVLYWTILMQLGTGNRYRFRTGVALSVTILWLKLLGYLRNMLIDFAVFVHGLFYVVRCLAAFLLASTIILIAFSQVFFTLFQDTNYCRSQPYQNLDVVEYYEMLSDLSCEGGQKHEFCDFWYTFIALYTMLLGNVNDNKFNNNYLYYYNGKFYNAATAVFVIFMFVVAILLANVLIAIVIDRYRLVQERRAAIVFWTNRLDFVAEMDAIANGPWKSRLKQSLPCQGRWCNGGPRNDGTKATVDFGKEYWKHLMDLFEDEIDESLMSVEFICYTLLRGVAAVFVVPCWLILGFFTAGWLWPPQVREAVFTSTVAKHSSETDKEEELRKMQVKQLEQEVKELRDDLLEELEIGRALVLEIKAVVADRKQEIANEMKHIKRIMTMLFEQLSSFDG